ncbi:S9 family peptidase [Cellulomonas carbonis]|uniref:Peptidase S9 n=1 Tax=Cellulomonas carbonis T26 TaxID=947969 RepID=A0A0A0BSZ9_9CELL|nr:S9 family peptidase [Cellulomonas carbonis]KGM10787.1 peptidase S9 [Cellulomonas carbonis T26]GGB92718.1 dipeptidyl aminopeptidase [Cellulomonas carbonis]
MIPRDIALLRSPGSPALSPDGSTAVVPVLRPDLEADEYTGSLWVVPVDGSAPARRLTRGHRDTSPAWSPDGRWIAFVRAEPKGRPQLHVVEAGGGEPVRLTDAPLGVSEPRFSPDGTRIAYLARVPEEGRYVEGGDAAGEPPRHITTFRYRADGIGFLRDRRQHLFVLDLPADPSPGGLPTPVALTGGDLDVSGHRWLPDGEHLVVVGAVHDGREEDLLENALLVVARRTPEDADTVLEPDAPRQLTDAGTSTLSVQTVEPSPDGSTLWLLASDMGPSRRAFVASQTGLFSLDLDPAPGSPEPLPVAQRHTDAEDVDLVAGVLAVTADRVLVADQRRGSVVLAALPADGSGSLRTVLDGNVVVQHAVATTDGATAVAVVATPDSAGDLVALRLADHATTWLTDLSAELRETGRTHLPREAHATAPDGHPVHGWVAVPDADRFGAGPHPTVLMIHGGPYAQYTHALFDEVQTLVGAGYAVVLGNPRGSAGYGASHGRAIQRAFGTVDADDVLALLDHVLADPTLALDAERVGVMGGSYGGYLTAWLTTRTDRFTAAIVERGFLDPVSFVGSSDIGWFFGLEYLGDVDTPEAAAALAAQSPMAQVHRVRTPTLVIHSEQDWRCPVEQGQRWFVELKRRGVEAELLLFPGEGHELTRSGRPAHRVARFEHVLAWWARHLPVTTP